MRSKYGRELYSLAEFYQILYLMLRTGKYMSRAKKSGSLSTQLIERIMLAVTEINRCPLCSYGHTKMALESGMSLEEIQKLLSCCLDDVPKDEVPAVLFAQHYADNRAHPSSEAWNSIVDRYGIAEARGILGAVRMIMFGNAIGIVLSSLSGRLSGKPDPRNSLVYELSILFTFLPFLAVAFLHALLSNLLGLPIIDQ